MADGVISEKVSCPLGVLLVVSESRPDALVQVNVIIIVLGVVNILSGLKICV